MTNRTLAGPPPSPRCILVLEGVAPGGLGAPENVVVLQAKHTEITAELIENARPDLVIAPLVGIGFDGVDVARRLGEAGFRGQVRLVARVLPDPGMVRQEFAAHFPALDVDLIVLGRDQGVSRQP